jgi:hypothetical protein
MIDLSRINREKIQSPLQAKGSQTPPVDTAKEAASRCEAEEAVKTYKYLTSEQGFAGLSPSQIAKKLAAINKLFKPEPIVFLITYKDAPKIA